MPGSDSIRLGVMTPLTGLVGIYGQDIACAAKVACQEVNENGGVLGRTLELIIEDDGSLPESSVTAAETLVQQHRCAGIIGNLLSNSRIAVAYRVAEPLKIPYLNFSFYEGSISSRYFFHFAALPNQQIDKMIPQMQQMYGPKMFFAGNNYEWPRGSIAAAIQTLEKSGGEVVGQDYFPIGVGQDEIQGLLDNVEDSGANVFVPYFAGTDQVNLLTAFTERGLKGRIAVVMGHYDETMASRLPSDVRSGFYSSNTYYMSVATPENRRFLERLQSLPEITGIWPDGNGTVSNFGEGAYICVKAFAEAANAAASIDPEALVDALETIRLVGPQGEVQMDRVTHHAKVNTYLSRCQSDGTFEIVKSFGAVDPVLPERYRHVRVRPQAHLEEDIRLQARILEQITEAVLLVDSSDGKIIYNNFGAENMFGFSRQELAGKLLAELVVTSTEAAESVPTDLEDVVFRKGVWKGDILIRNRDGGDLWCATTVSAFTHAEHGEVWMVVLNDITQRKQVEQRFRTLVEATPAALIVVDEFGHMNMVNQEAENTFGYNRGELVGQIIEMLLPERYQEEHPSLRAGYNEAPQLRAMDSGRGLYGRRKDGGKFPIEVGLSPVEIDGRAMVLAFIIDITDRLKLEQESQQHREALSHVSRINTMGEMATGIAHELNQPLTAIASYSFVARTALERVTFSPSDLQETLGKLEDQAVRAGDIVRRLRNFLKKSESVRTPTDLNSLVRTVAMFVDPDIQRAETLLVLKLDEVPPIVLVDEIQVQQVLVNLVRNAIDAMQEMPTGQRKVIVSTRVLQGGQAEVTVSDAGIGLTEDELEQVFDTFFSTKQEGMGMGLPISRSIVEAHGGKLWAESNNGPGATFGFTILLDDGQG
ncbi:MAG: ABC transporter substrate-binding protein [Planctomycetaceae bacterium]|nr:ABC transporter substrate-binding protein [Planctomycetaceae bacterium]MBT6157834.1 ABC transporter substrate-binding protein [Planctomycetaceae bacterium]MBT6487096.1 ABC transporter substrate-binding protein [Planctomycetaceae bacterium]MBT6495734.1 ABC transporter substrate-binding protein [Planctomycetaceae bacterium]